jgi:hypothetical protein
MLEHLIVEPMRGDFMLWRCLHSGPLTQQSIEHPRSHPAMDWPAIRSRNIPLIEKLMQTYGTCAIVARDGDAIVGSLRFYPKALCEFGDSGLGFCLQQSHPAGPADDLASRDFPPLEKLADKTLFVHCLMIASHPDEPNRYKRKGLATRMAGELIHWARRRGWHAIEANAYEDIPMLYAIAGVAGKTFWLKLGFQLVHQDIEPGIQGKFLQRVRDDAVAAGIPAENAANRYRMRLELRPQTT